MEPTLPGWAPWVGTGSLLMFAGAIVFLPLIVKKLPGDYFVRPRKRAHRRPVFRVMGLIVKNIIGFIFLILGVIMLFVPGQGLLTMAAGLALMNFPGKAVLLNRLLTCGRLQSGLNRLRRRQGMESFRFPPEQ